MKITIINEPNVLKFNVDNIDVESYEQVHGDMHTFMYQFKLPPMSKEFLEYIEQINGTEQFQLFLSEQIKEYFLNYVKIKE